MGLSRNGGKCRGEEGGARGHGRVQWLGSGAPDPVSKVGEASLAPTSQRDVRLPALPAARATLRAACPAGGASACTCLRRRVAAWEKVIGWASLRLNGKVEY